MRFRILGQLEVDGDDGAVALGGTKPRAVLAVLLLHANEAVSAERLALALWGDDARDHAVKVVRVHVSRLRKALREADRIVTTSAGYRLCVHPGELDAARFETLVDDARRAAAGDPSRRTSRWAAIGSSSGSCRASPPTIPCTRGSRVSSCSPSIAADDRQKRSMSTATCGPIWPANWDWSPGRR